METFISSVELCSTFTKTIFDHTFNAFLRNEKRSSEPLTNGVLQWNYCKRWETRGHQVSMYGYRDVLQFLKGTTLTVTISCGCLSSLYRRSYLSSQKKPNHFESITLMLRMRDGHRHVWSSKKKSSWPLRMMMNGLAVCLNRQQWII